MVGKVQTATVIGLDAVIIDVEAVVSMGLPNTIVVGLPDTAVQESRERVKAAVKSSGCSYPPSRVSVNLAPADVHKNGTHFDVPIALAVILASEELEFLVLGKLFVGELSLDGRVRSVPGVLAICLAAQRAGFDEIYVPFENIAEATLVSGIFIYPISSLTQLLKHLRGLEFIERAVATVLEVISKRDFVGVDMKDVSGQELAKRAMEVAASGAHNLLMYGPPGSGKTLLARAMATILPVLSTDEILELTKIYSIAGKLQGGYVSERPVRHPHHTTSHSALVGGGSYPKPGEITLAHRGILFLDEFAEFPRSVLETLRQPLEDGVVTIARAKDTLTFPARFILVAALNPCPCGFLGDSSKRCQCTPVQIQKYQRKLSGPLLDRIDLHVEVPRLPYEKLEVVEACESSATVVERVENARQRQRERYGKEKTNSEMNVVDIRSFCGVRGDAGKLIKDAMKQFHLSGRSMHRILKVGRTIADLAGSETIEMDHVAEALQYRPK